MTLEHAVYDLTLEDWRTLLVHAAVDGYRVGRPNDGDLFVWETDHGVFCVLEVLFSARRRIMTEFLTGTRCMRASDDLVPVHSFNLVWVPGCTRTARWIGAKGMVLSVYPYLEADCLSSQTWIDRVAKGFIRPLNALSRDDLVTVGFKETGAPA